MYIYIYMYDWVTLLYSKNWHSTINQLYFNKRILKKKTIPFTTDSKRVKYLGMNITKEVKDLYTGHWWKKLKTQINGKIFHAHRLEELTLWKWPYYPKWSTDLIQPISKFQWLFPQKWTILKFIWNHKKERRTKLEDHTAWLQTILQSYSNQKSIALAGVPITAQQVKDLMLSLWGCKFNPWPHSVG